ncbi:MAG TPA: T9SS type A sorting domain-containing protein [Bacteroidia bacterium]|jgi:hypothetical protein|nr:T9SS type A sorting domain-containing protein [Bacteroidia bacterium]
MKKLLLFSLLFIIIRTGSSQCYSVSPITYAPDSFNAGTVLPQLLDDHYTCAMTLPFPFCFFGSTYTRYIIGSNGNVSFDTTYACSYDAWPISSAIPSPSNLHKNTISMPWEDLAPDTGFHIYTNTYGVTPNRRFVISFYHAPLYNCTTLVFTGEVALYETSNNVDIIIQNKPDCPTWNSGYGIEGMQDAAGVQAAVVPGRNYPSQWTAVNDAYRFSPNCCTMGIVAQGNDELFSVFPNPSGGDLHFISRNFSVNEFYLTLEDVSGRMIYADQLSSDAERHIALDAPRGVYFLQMRGRNGEILASKKIVIE